MLSYVPAAGAFVSYRGMFGPGTGVIYTSLRGTPIVANRCTHKDDAGVYCMEEVVSVCSTGSARLTGSSLNATNEGILEVCVNNQWGTVCDDSWNEVGADIACRMAFKNDSSEKAIPPICVHYACKYIIQALNIHTCTYICRVSYRGGALKLPRPTPPPLENLKICLVSYSKQNLSSLVHDAVAMPHKLLPPPPQKILYETLIHVYGSLYFSCWRDNGC